MGKVTTTTYLTSNLELKTIVRERDDKGRFVKGGKKEFKPSSFDVGRVLEKKAETSVSLKQFESRARYVLGGKTDKKMKEGYEQILNTVIDSNVGDKGLASFFMVMNDLGPEGFDRLYQQYPEYIDSMYDYYSENKDGQIVKISNRKQKMKDMLYGSGDNGFLSRAGYSEADIKAKLTKIAIEDAKHNNLSEADVLKKIQKDPNYIYRSYLTYHYDETFKKVR